MDYLQKKFKKSQDSAGVVSEKEYKYASLQAVLKETVKEGSRRQLKELVEEVNSHLTDLRGLSDEKDLRIRERTQYLIDKYEECLVKLLNGEVKQAQVDNEVKPEPKIAFNEVEQKLKLMRQKRLNRLSTFVNEQTKLSEQRSELARIEDRQEIKSTRESKEHTCDIDRDDKIAFRRSEPDQNSNFARNSAGKVAEIRSSFGKAAGPTEKIVMPRAQSRTPAPIKELPKIQFKLPQNQTKGLDSPRTPTQMRKLFNSFSSCVTDQKPVTSPEDPRDAFLQEIKQLQLRRPNVQHSEDADSFVQEHRKSPRQPIAVCPPRIPSKPTSKVDPMTKSVEEPKADSENANALKRVSSGPGSLSIPDPDPLDFTIMSVRRSNLGESFGSTDRSSFSTFRSSKDSFKGLPEEKILDTPAYVEVQSAADDSEIEKSVADLLKHASIIRSLLGNKHGEDIQKIGSYRELLDNLNRQLRDVTRKIESQLGASVELDGINSLRDEVFHLQKSINSFKGLRRDLEYLVLASSLSKIKMELNDMPSRSEEAELRRVGVLERVTAAEAKLEDRVDSNERTLMLILKTQVSMLGDKYIGNR
ncbi:uncharacterized protein LOC132699426 [Cylas formicarius]|uniref:uncharacterized protein LOC132699426 n=1 Tax=Cylas formicarius TaxID=197179 RepID=UPI002958A3BC|nr:uncharacterized protein LOC132699426 [Cylas formicarius]XP_060522107.1 uncharacterized protein LOC132699426 [Cylas formicarius]